MDYIVLHHSLTEDGHTVSWNAIRDYHKAQGWDDIGYHFGIEEIGNAVEILVGRTVGTLGAHTKELRMNARSIGICVVGNYDLIVPSEAHLAKLHALLVWLCRDYGIPAKNVVGHREVGEMAGLDWRRGHYKTCPGTLFPLDLVRSRLTA